MQYLKGPSCSSKLLGHDWLAAAKRVIEPIKNASIRETVSAALAVRSGALRGCETDHGLRTGEVLINNVRLALQVHIFFGIEDQCRTRDLLRDAGFAAVLGVEYAEPTPWADFPVLTGQDKIEDIIVCNEGNG
jgi:hypothetical protein